MENRLSPPTANANPCLARKDQFARFASKRFHSLSRDSSVLCALPGHPEAIQRSVWKLGHFGLWPLVKKLALAWSRS